MCALWFQSRPRYVPHRGLVRHCDYPWASTRRPVGGALNVSRCILIGYRSPVHGTWRHAPIVSRSTRDIDGRLAIACDSDPRVRGEYIRHIPTTGGSLVLVGVVHDHPASIYRAEAIIDTLDPDVVAVELPDILIPPFAAAIASDDRVGGEMSAAMRAAGTDAVLGIDVPSRGLVSAVSAAISTHEPGLLTVGRTLRSVGKMVGHSALGRLAHAGVPGLPTVRDLEHSQAYDISVDATPRAQADHEAAHLGRSTTLLRAFEPPPATRLMDAIREQHMADRLESICRERTVVAVVGYSHLDGIAATLRNKPG